MGAGGSRSCSRLLPVERDGGDRRSPAKTAIVIEPEPFRFTALVPTQDLTGIPLGQSRLLAQLELAQVFVDVQLHSPLDEFHRQQRAALSVRRGGLERLHDPATKIRLP